MVDKRQAKMAKKQATNQVSHMYRCVMKHLLDFSNLSPFLPCFS